MEIEGLQNGLTSAIDYDRFDNASAFIGNPGNWPAGAPPVNNPYPWTGVGRGINGAWGTMISPSYIVSADHFAPSGTVRFYYTNNPNGPYEDRTIVASEWLETAVPGDSSDVWIAKLNQPVSSNVAIYPLLSLPKSSDYSGLGIATFGLSDVPSGVDPVAGNSTSVRLGRNTINWASTTAYSSGTTLSDGPYVMNYTYQNPGVGADESYQIAGDSGAPTFFEYAGSKPALLGVHWFTDVNSMGIPYSADSFLPPYASDIQTAMNQLASQTGTAPESVTTVSPLMGDFNLDGKVNLADLAAMMNAVTHLSSYKTLHGMNTAYLDYIGDINHDGAVNNEDLQALLNWFKSGGGTSLGAVPEPNTLVLFAMGAGMLVIVLRRRNLGGITT
ncbi:MAG TPA: PEP-CTERM sorting domain-containing protein [Pirellulales bacterium]|jgi:hypothetical protein|nr:PEP-CTERM sorting domain-containing protein [Pirellulales bacterium]